MTVSSRFSVATSRPRMPRDMPAAFSVPSSTLRSARFADIALYSSATAITIANSSMTPTRTSMIGNASRNVASSAALSK